MSDKPILFSGPMVRALLAGTKTQTRRKINPQPVVNSAGLLVWTTPRVTAETDADGLGWHMRIGKGDRLWVRENFAISPTSAWALPKTVSPDRDMAAYYHADFDRSGRPRWKPSIHMPRWASRLTLHVTDVRVQRLQEITDSDAFAEGIPTSAPVAGHEVDIDGDWWPGAARNRYRKVWDSINGDGAWDSNPWVAAYTFTVEQVNIDKARAA